MEVALFLFVNFYFVVVLTSIVVAINWSVGRGFGFFKTAGLVLATLFLLYAIPFGDHTLGEIRKHQLCREYGGVKIYVVIENVDGFMWAQSGRQGDPPHTTYGYTFFESSDMGDRIYRYTKQLDGSIDSQIVEKPRSRYVVRSTPYEKIGQQHSVRKFTIVDVHDNKILAAHGFVAFDGGWLGFGRTICPEGPFDPVGFVQQVLKPAKSN